MLDIKINSVFLEDQSLPEESIYLWAYHITIINNYQEKIKIKRRIFEVIDSVGQKQIIEGVGVTGDQPEIEVGGKFEYASGVLLSHPSGFFSGRYVLELEDGSIVEEEIPSFSLDSRYETSQIQ